MTDLFDWLVAHAGGPVPCAICRTPTLTADLTECWAPAAVTTFGFVVRRAVWVCPDCPTLVDA